jgi:hypothetical protein
MPVGQTPFSGLPFGVAFTGVEIFPADQGGVTCQFSLNQVSAFISGKLGSITSSIIPATSDTYTLGSASFSYENAYFGPNAVPVFDPASGNIGYYARTAQEQTAGVTPTDYVYPPGDVRRYGALGNGSNDDTTAIQTACNIAETAATWNVLLPAGLTFKISSYIQIFSNTTIYLLGTVSLQGGGLNGRQAGFFCNGSGSVGQLGESANNINILGFGVGTIVDPVVKDQVTAQITNITQAASAQITINTVSATNPFTVGQLIGISGIPSGMTQIANQAALVSAIGGASGAWTVTVLINSTSYTAYTSGGTLNYGYFFNPGTPTQAPAIHVRSGVNVLIDGLIVNYVNQGIYVSNYGINYSTTGNFTPAQGNSSNVRVRNCTVTNTEWSGIANFSSQDSCVQGNYVYRCGDGGLWMMGCNDCEVISNHRISPATVYANTLTYGSNNEAQPTTWQDNQGMEFENCHNLLISENLVKYFWAEPIDIKQGSNRVLCTANRIFNCEQNGIVVRAGDPGDTNACWKVSIIGNTISSQGYTLIGLQTSAAVGAIAVSSCFQAEILDNVIYSYQQPVNNSAGTFAGINCTGPGSPNYIGDANHQSHLIIKGNSVDFTALANSTDQTEFDYTNVTPTAIQVNGLIDSVHISGNKIAADYYSGSDIRANSNPAIAVTYNYYVTNNSYYPTNCKVDENTVCNWGGAGINVTAAGISGMTASGLSVCGNNLGCLGEYFISVNQCSYANISNNVCNQMNAGNVPGISLIGINTNYMNGTNCTNNVISGSWQTGGNGMTYGIAASFVNNCNLSNNTIVNPVNGNFNIGTYSGNLVLSGSTGFPRSGTASPSGTVGAYYLGEPYLDTTTPAWYWATGNGGATTWITS